MAFSVTNRPCSAATRAESALRVDASSLSRCVVALMAVAPSAIENIGQQNVFATLERIGIVAQEAEKS